jgi:hypothetical protein
VRCPERSIENLERARRVMDPTRGSRRSLRRCGGVCFVLALPGSWGVWCTCVVLRGGSWFVRAAREVSEDAVGLEGVTYEEVCRRRP